MAGRLYNLKAWQDLREWQLSQEPLCEFCKLWGRVTPASVVHHETPHRGDRALFFDPENLKSLCAPCHDSLGAEQDDKGFHSLFGEDGEPLDPNHPWHST